MNTWSNKNIKDGKNFKELITYEEVSLWWFADRWLRDNDMHLLKIVSAQQIINYLSDPHNEIENKTDNEIKKELSERLLKGITKKKTKFRIMYFLFMLKQVFRYWYLKFFKKNPVIKKNHTKKKKILILTNSSTYKTRIDPISKKEIKADEYFEPIIKKLKREGYLVKAVDIGYNPKLQLDALREKEPPLWSFYEQYLTKSINSKVKREQRVLKKWWWELNRTKGFVNSFEYSVKSKKINLYPYLKDTFEFMFKYRFPEAIKEIETVKNIIEKEKPDAMLLIDEADTIGRCIVTAAKLKKVPVIAIQHGVIGLNHPAYMHSKGDISPHGKVKAPYCPIPDKLAVYGPHEKKILTKINFYPKNSVVVTGQPRYDFLRYANKIFNKKEIIKKYNLPKDKKFILWATQTHGLSIGENIKNIKAIFRAMEKLQNKYHLLIKLHPNENQNARLYKRFLKNKTFATIINGKQNTYELIYLSEAVIIKNSTVGTEAILMNKPIFITEIIKSIDVSLYTSYGFKCIIKKHGDLVKYIKRLNDEKVIRDFQKKRGYFLKDRLTNFGCATEKVYEVIKKVINKKHIQRGLD